MKRRTFYPTNKERPIFKWTLDDGGPLLAHYKDGASATTARAGRATTR
jgi:hypothetical protein